MTTKIKDNLRDWKSRILAQYSVFGIIAGLEITALAGFLGNNKISKTIELDFIGKTIFSIVYFFLILQILIILLMINAERIASYEVMQDNQNGRYYKARKNEKYWRIGLIVVIFIGVVSILSLAYYSLVF